MHYLKDQLTELNNKDTLYTYFALMAQSERFGAHSAMEVFTEEGRLLINYQELLGLVDQYAEYLITERVIGTVGLLTENNAAWVVATLAIAKLGLPMAALKYADIANLDYFVAATDTKHIVSDIIADDTPLHVLALPSLKLSATPQKRVVANKNPQAVLWYSFSSGTTGKPKAVSLSSYNIVNNARFVGKAMGLNAQHRVVSLFPFFAAGGMVVGVFGPLFSGASIVTSVKVGSIRRQLGKVLHDAKVTALFGPPATITELLTQSQHPFPDLKKVMIGSAPFSAQFFNEVQAKLNQDLEMITTYGQTEAGVITHVGVYQDPIDLNAAVPSGYLLPHIKARVVSAQNGVELGANERGLLQIKGYSVMQEYYMNAEKTQETLIDGWLDTGDLVMMKSDGLMEIHGRKSILMIDPRDPEKLILPIDIEPLFNSLMQLNAVQEYVVVTINPTTNPQFGIFIKSRDVDIESVKREVIQILIEQDMLKVDTVVVDTTIPLNASLKVDRFAVQKSVQLASQMEQHSESFNDSVPRYRF